MNRNTRMIARLDIKGPNVIKGVHLEGLRVVGEPNEFALNYYEHGADELVFMDTVASLYGRNHLGEIIKKAAENIFIPMTVGGGIRGVNDALDILRCGADKIAINTSAVSTPSLIAEISNALGSQAVVLSVEAKMIADNKWEVYTDNGREATGLDVVGWVQKGESLGVGEILLTSVDKEGTRKGFDLSLISAVTAVVNIPVIASGGFGKPQDFLDVVREANADAVAIADAFHFNRYSIPEIREIARKGGLKLRDY